MYIHYKNAHGFLYFNFSRYRNYTFKTRLLQILSGLNQNNKYLNFVALNDFNMFCLIFSNFNPSWSTPRSLLKPPRWALAIKFRNTAIRGPLNRQTFKKIKSFVWFHLNFHPVCNFHKKTYHFYEICLDVPDKNKVSWK